jgi:23S rRNA (uracil1939-C5)-methyltransferase
MEVRVEKLVYGGFGLAHHDGLVLFIPHAAPGDRLLVKPVQEKRGYVIAHIEDILEASPHRRTPVCPHYQDCGGCQLQHLTYEAQLEAKLGFIRESLGRIGGLEWTDEIPPICGQELHYRLRAQLKVGREGSETRLGYFRAESHDLCAIDSCPLLSERLNMAIPQLLQCTAERLEGMKTIDLVEGDGGQIASHPTLDGFGSDNVQISVGDISYCIDGQAFFQVNRFLLEEMISAVVSGERGQRAVDLYCGAGFFTIPLARSFEHTIGVESNSHAIRLAANNAGRNQLEGVEFSRAPVEDWLKERGSLRGEVDLVVIDPPRQGLTRKIIRGLGSLCPNRITYVSCNPATLARDLRHLCTEGYTISSIGAIDLFPQTFHIETVAKLQRN